MRALYINCSLKRSDQKSHTWWLIDTSRQLLQKQWVECEVIRFADYTIPPGVYSDMNEHWYETDQRHEIFQKILASNILVVWTPIRLGESSSICRKLIERIYSNSWDRNEKWQSIYYGRVGWCLVTWNEDGVKHCAMSLLYSLQHVWFTIPPQADAGWVGEIWPGKSYMDAWSWWPDNEFTNRNVTIMTYTLLHAARMLEQSGWYPSEGTSRNQRDSWERFGYENPEYW